MNFERSNAFDDSHFPNSWDEEDFNFLAEFCRVEFDAEVVGAIDDPDDYDYYLFVQTEADR